MEKVQDILEKLLSYDTSTQDGVLKCYQYVKNLLEKSGVKTETLYSKEQPGILWGVLPAGNDGKKSGGILLSGHLDVVSCNRDKWETDPFQIVKKGDNLYGRGTCDMKGFLACALANIVELKGKKTYSPIHLCMSFDEESDMLAVKKAGTFLKKYRPDWCWVGEPSSMKIIDRHRGNVTGRIRIKGRAAHGSTPEKGLSATYIAFDIIEHIRGIEKEKKKNPFPNSPFEVPYTVFNIGTIQGGTAENTVADFCEFTYQYRPHPGENIDEINKSIDSFIQQKVKPKFVGFPEAGIEHVRQIDDSLDNVDKKAYRNMSVLLGNCQTKAESYVTEAGFFQKNGISTIVCGPGSIEQAHRENEFVPIIELKRCNAMVLTLCQYLCSGKEQTLAQFVKAMRQGSIYKR